MAKTVDDTVLDGALNIIKNNANLMTLCSTQPTTRTEAITTYELADVAVTSTDFTVANGDTSGRKVTVAAKSTVPVDVTGNGQFVALTSATLLLFVTTCTAQQVTLGNTVDIPAWKYEIADPT
jgi:Flp pilus assembly protein TadG